MHKNPRVYKTISITLSIFYFASLFYVVFFSGRRNHLGGRHLNITPFKNTVADFNDLIDIGLFNYLSNIFGNILLFIPLPFILAIVFKITRLSSVLLTGFLLSFSIELLQFLFDAGVADIDDIIFNTLGTFTGYLCFRIYKKSIRGL